MKTQFVIHPGAALRGLTRVPGDKSISHRAVMFGALAHGTSQVTDWLAAGDTEATFRSVSQLVPIQRHDTHSMTIEGGQFTEFSTPPTFDLVNAGTGIRLLAGIMVGQPFASVLDGSEQLRRRPMKRIIDPLRLMGARIEAENNCAPLRIEPAALTGIDYLLPMASAQVKSSLLLAGLFADGATSITEPGPARDHTERMLRAMGADIASDGYRVTLRPGKPLQPFTLAVPGDFSSAAFLMVGGCIVPGSDLTIENVNLNVTRTGLLDILMQMGAQITVSDEREQAGEPIGTLRVQHSALQGVEIGGDLVVRMIDEFPALMVAALLAEGETIVRDAQELRVKETDRIAVMATELRKFGAEITETADGFRITGPQRLHGAEADSHDDHRIAMSMTLAGLVAAGRTVVHDAACAGDSFPGFAGVMTGLGAQLEEQADDQ